MASIGTLEILKKQTQNKRLLKALDYLAEADLNLGFTNVTPDTKQIIKIDGDKIFAIFQTYTSLQLTDIKIEGHKKYIDIQYIFSGEERILLASEKDILTPDTYNSEKDVHFPKAKDFSQLFLRKGEAAIFYPEDLHGPCYAVDKPSKVRKIVVKVAVD